LTPDLDIFHAARLMIDQHGKYAPLRAARRADDLFAARDMMGSAVWRRILSAIEELGRGRRGGEKLN
jgi:hypothetical protein